MRLRGGWGGGGQEPASFTPQCTAEVSQQVYSMCKVVGHLYSKNRWPGVFSPRLWLHLNNTVTIVYSLE